MALLCSQSFLFLPLFHYVFGKERFVDCKSNTLCLLNVVNYILTVIAQSLILNSKMISYLTVEVISMHSCNEVYFLLSYRQICYENFKLQGKISSASYYICMIYIYVISHVLFLMKF